MSFSADPLVEGFLKRFLRVGGAVFEEEAGGVQALLPESMAGRLKVPEMVHLSAAPDFEPDQNSAQAVAVTYGSPILEKMLHEAGAEPPLIGCRLHFNYLKSGGFTRLIRETFDIEGALVEVEGDAQVQSEYLHLTFSYLIQSDEQREGLVSATVNLESGAEIDGVEEMLPALDKKFYTPGDRFPWGSAQVDRLRAWAEKRASGLVAEAIRPFEARMNKRLRRDVESLEAYYAALSKEMEAGLNRAGLSEKLIRDRKEKIALLPEEMARKKKDLYKRYGIRVQLRPCCGMLIRTPAVKLLVRFEVGKRRKTLPFLYNPIVRKIDPMVCGSCGQSTYRIRVFRDLATLCLNCTP